ncbi:MAG TPA: hypothetical protein VNE86_02680 [Nitrososphaerales archaeon]|nr:hypothetical protein [Nitrososphaerales archaeon]
MKNKSIIFGLLLIVVAAIVGVELAGTLITSPPPTVPVTISCTLPGITCASFKIDSANLTAAASDVNATLSITWTNTSTGSNTNSTAVTYFIENIELAQSHGVADNQTEVYVLQVPQLYGIVSGNSYTITAQTIIGGQTLSQNITVVAK